MTRNISFTDLARQNGATATLDTGGEGLSAEHTVQHGIEWFVSEHLEIAPGDGVTWAAYSRGVRLDATMRLADVSTEDDVLVIPEVSAG